MNFSLSQIYLSGLFLLLGSWPVIGQLSAAQPSRTIANERWVQVRQIDGTVTSQGRPIRVGEYLAMGDVIKTSNNSRAMLVVDDGIGMVKVSELADVQVQNLAVLPNGGKTTKFFVSKGQVRAIARHLTNPNSSFEIAFRGDDEEVEGGIAGTRGTEYGVAVSPNGQTGITTVQGNVAVTALNQTVFVKAGTSSLVVPGQPPMLPRSTPSNLQLKLQLLSVTTERQVRVIAEVDPINLVYLNGQPVEVDRNGKLDKIVPLSDTGSVSLVVRSPLGDQQVYELSLPPSP
ncbi:MAG TPA: iron dicitrate transport regulator FecR [Cyanobacteria bacterium UBA8803]|nr:iron dicitrate transport regulator FecR [Cyanobacteria bacterium UBA9273]HBL57748.1 iron dicitrate transport regulator FecR [Cyanobacteria bacterium UBA8803]